MATSWHRHRRGRNENLADPRGEQRPCDPQPLDDSVRTESRGATVLQRSVSTVTFVAHRASRRRSPAFPVTTRSPRCAAEATTVASMAFAPSVSVSSSPARWASAALRGSTAGCLADVSRCLASGVQAAPSFLSHRPTSRSGDRDAGPELLERAIARVLSGRFHDELAEHRGGAAVHALRRSIHVRRRSFVERAASLAHRHSFQLQVRISCRRARDVRNRSAYRGGRCGLLRATADGAVDSELGPDRVDDGAEHLGPFWGAFAVCPGNQWRFLVDPSVAVSGRVPVTPFRAGGSVPCDESLSGRGCRIERRRCSGRPPDRQRVRMDARPHHRRTDGCSERIDLDPRWLLRRQERG